MRINPTIYSAYGKSSPTRTMLSAKEKTETVPGFRLSSEEQEAKVANKNVTPAKRDLNSIMSKYQEDTTISKINSSIVSTDKIAVASSKTADIDNQDLSAQYKTPESIYDIPNSELKPRLGQAISESKLLHTEGMTKVDIYKQVQSIFEDYLGKDYLEPSIVYDGALGTLAYAQDSFSANDYQQISNSFDGVLRKLGVTNSDSDGHYDPSVIIETKGYTGMSENEMRSAVRSEYPENMTLKDCIFMADELAELGLETTGYGRATVENIFTTLSLANIKIANTAAGSLAAKKVFDIMLENPCDFDGMKETIESYRAADGHLVFSYEINLSEDEVLDSLLSWVGGKNMYDTDMLDNLMKLLESEKEQ